MAKPVVILNPNSPDYERLRRQGVYYCELQDHWFQIVDSLVSSKEQGLAKIESDEAVKQEAMVEEFIEEHRPILEDPDAGHGALSRIYVHAAQLITPLGKKSEEAAHRATKATNDLTAAINDPRCSAGKVDKREKEYKRLLSEHERLSAAFHSLTDFAALVKQRLDNEFDENGTPKSAPKIEPPSSSGRERHAPWWQRLFGQRTENS